MRFNKIIPYNMKRLVPMLGLAGATIFGACSKDDDPVPTRDVLLYFSLENSESLRPEKIKEIASQPDVRTIYLIPQGDWLLLRSDNITYMRKNGLEPAINASEKTTGGGDFRFSPGVASQVKEDSIWITKQNWTINKNLQKQK